MIALPPPNDRSPQARQSALDGLRFLAAFAVLAYHFTARAQPSWGAAPEEVFPSLHLLTSYGAFGVDLFFVISGFVILMSAWGRNVPQFVASRIGRLFPAYWAGVALTGALLLVVWNRHKDVSVSQVLLNLTMLQSAFNVDHLDGVYWTLWVELRFYVIIALFIALGITMNRVVVLAATWPALAAIAHYQDFPFLAEVLVASDAPYFAGGMMLFVISQNPRSTIAWLVLLQNVLIAGAWGSRGTVSGIARNSAVEPTAFAGFAFATACFIAVAICVLTPLRRLNVRWLTGLGALTYPLYITHEYWGWWFISVLSERVGREFTLVLTVAACLLMAWLIHRYIERPFGPRLRRAVQRSVDSLRSSNPESQLSRP